MMRQISPAELAAWLGDASRPAPLMLDVREPWEVAIAAMPGAVTIPMGRIVEQADGLDASRPIVCVCHHGVRSMQVAAYLARRGFDDVLNLSGGIDAWARQVDPACPTY